MGDWLSVCISRRSKPKSFLSFCARISGSTLGIIKMWFSFSCLKIEVDDYKSTDMCSPSKELLHVVCYHYYRVAMYDLHLPFFVAGSDTIEKQVTMFRISFSIVNPGVLLAEKH